MEIDLISRFGERLKTLRLENKLTQREAAAKIGVTATSLSAYENGTQIPSVEIAIRAAIIFNVPLEWICGISADDARDYQKQNLKTALMLFTMLCNVHAISIEVENKEDEVLLKGLTVEEPLRNFLMVYYQTTQLHNKGLLTDDSYSSISGANVDKTAKELVEKYFR